MPYNHNLNKGFTLIEVLIALAIIAVAFTALLKATAQITVNNQRLHEKMVSQWAALQGVAIIQLGLLPLSLNQEITEVTNLLDQRWYWRAKITATPLRTVQQITITVSKQQSGPFKDPLIAFRSTL